MLADTIIAAWQKYRSRARRRDRRLPLSARQASGGRVLETLEPRLLLATTALQINPALSHLSVAVAVENGALSFGEQAAGSLTTSYDGTILANLSSASLTFTSPSSASANTSGNWQPGLVPADYGGEASILGQSSFATINNIQFGLTSAPLTLATEGAFSPTGIQFAVQSGLIHADLGSFGSVDRSLVGFTSDDDSVLLGSVQPGAGGGSIITIPVHLVYFFSLNAFNDSTITFDGTLVATSGGAVTSGANLTLLHGSTLVFPGQTQPVIFGPAARQNPPPLETFTVINTGDQTLTLGAPTIPPGFTLVEGPPSTLPVGASATFQIALNTDSAGSFFGLVTIPTNDQSANPFTFTVAGDVTAPAQSLLSVAQVVLRHRSRPIMGGTRRASCRVDVLIVNNNPDHLTGTLLLRLFAVTDPFLPPDPTMQLRPTRKIRIALAGNAQRTIKLRVALPALPAGTYFIMAAISGPNVEGGTSSDVSASGIRLVS